TRVSTIGSQSGFDTVLWVFRGASVTNLSLVASNDDSGGNNKSLALFTATNGVTYQIRVRGFSASDTGFIVLNLHETNTPPTCIITNPLNNATAPAGSTVTINAWASDFATTSLGSSGVTNVEFFDGAIKLGQDTTSPFSF